MAFVFTGNHADPLTSPSFSGRPTATDNDDVVMRDRESRMNAQMAETERRFKKQVADQARQQKEFADAMRLQQEEFIRLRNNQKLLDDEKLRQENEHRLLAKKERRRKKDAMLRLKEKRERDLDMESLNTKIQAAEDIQHALNTAGSAEVAAAVQEEDELSAILGRRGKPAKKYKVNESSDRKNPPNFPRLMELHITDQNGIQMKQFCFKEEVPEAKAHWEKFGNSVDIIESLYNTNQLVNHKDELLGMVNKAGPVYLNYSWKEQQEYNNNKAREAEQEQKFGEVQEEQTGYEGKQDETIVSNETYSFGSSSSEDEYGEDGY